MRIKSTKLMWMAAAGLVAMAVPMATNPVAAAEQAYGHAPQQAGASQMQARQGRYFSFVMPKGWRAAETTNGVEISHPNGLIKAEFALLINYQQPMTVSSFLQMALPHAFGRNARYASLRSVPGDLSLGPGWEHAAVSMNRVEQGTAQTGTALAATKSGPGLSIGMVWIAHAPDSEWESVRDMLSEIMMSVRITNPSQVAGLDTLIQPGTGGYGGGGYSGGSNSTHDGIISSGRYRDASSDWNSQQRRKALNGEDLRPRPGDVQRPRYPR